MSAATLGPHDRCSRRHPCRRCHHPDWCVNFRDGWTWCMRDETGRPSEKGGSFFWFGGGVAPTGDDWRDHLTTSTPPPEPPPDPAVRDRGLRALLDRCPLSDAHRADLRARGLTDLHIAAMPFGSLPADETARDRVAADLVAAIGPVASGNVPGLYAGGDGAPRLNAHPGLLIGVRAGGRLVGIKVRPDDEATRASGKYRWLSSNGKPGGVGSGAPCGVIYPAGWAEGASAPRVVATEGVLKGYVIANRLGLPVVAMPGATVTADVSRLVADFGATEVVTAFDNDRHTNPAVGRAEAGLIDELLAAGVAVLRATWPAAFKGLDDALAAGVLPVLEPVVDCAELRTENARLRSELAQTRNLYRAHLAAIRSPNLGAERVTAAAIVADLAHVPMGEWVPMGHKRVATNAGVSESVAPKHVERIKPALAGAVEIVKRWIPETVDPETGVLTGGHHQNFARRLVAATEALTLVATAPASAAGKRNGHGGERRCQRCGGDKITRHWVDKCDACGHVVAEGATTPTDPPAAPDKPKSGMASGNHQDGGFSDAPPDEGHRGGETEPLLSDDVPIAAESPAGHNDRAESGEPPWLADAPDPASDDPDQSCDTTLVAPPLTAARDVLGALELVEDGDDFKLATALLGDELAAVARAKGRAPVPKPRRRPMAPRDQPGADRWTWS